MKGTQLGEFERLERPMSLGAVHRTMQRLEEKGLVHSQFGASTAERGGRRKRLFTVTAAGEQVLQEARRIRNDLWADIPKAAFGGSMV